jgi:hypothetical protein
VLISIHPDSETFDRYVRNVIDVWDTCTTEQFEAGRHWYRTANQLANMISDGNTRKGAGVLAALSANKRWSTNVDLAVKAFDSGKPSGHFSDACDKARRIMAGEDPETVLPMDIKTGQFYRCILDPTDPESVVIDRHAHDIAVGVRYGDNARGLSSKSRYAMLANVYREAGEHFGYIPQIVQAVCWVVWIERNSS